MDSKRADSSVRIIFRDRDSTNFVVVVVVFFFGSKTTVRIGDLYTLRELRLTSDYGEQMNVNTVNLTRKGKTRVSLLENRKSMNFDIFGTKRTVSTR